MTNISTMLLANAYVRLQIVKNIIIGTPEFAVAFQITADAKLVSIGISMPMSHNVNAWNNPVQRGLAGTQKHAHVNVIINNVIYQVNSLIHLHASAVAITKHHKTILSILTW